VFICSETYCGYLKKSSNQKSYRNQKHCGYQKNSSNQKYYNNTEKSTLVAREFADIPEVKMHGK